MNRAQLFIGRLPKEVRRSDMEQIFGRYGRVTRCDIRVGLETAYAFIDYDDHRDAKDALKYENGREFHGQRMVVDWAIDDYKYGRYSKRATATGNRRGGGGGGGSGGGGGAYPRDNYYARSRSRSGSPPQRRDDHRQHRRKLPRAPRSPSRSRSRSRENGKGDTRRMGTRSRSISR